jgi:hypothetical protein
MQQFHLPPAPSVKHRYVTVDLGKFSPDHAGWLVVYDIDVSIAYNELAFRIGDVSLSSRARIQAAYDLISSIAVAWNFTTTNEALEVTAIPQPREGGANQIPESLLKPILDGFAEASGNTKNS